MPQKIALALIAAFTVFSFYKVAHAADFALTQIGVMSTGGANYSEWWYTGNNPTFVGTADADATVQYDVDGSTGSVTADSSGNWSYNAGLDGGDHAVSFSSGGSTISFTIHLGQSLPADVGGTTQSTTSVPDTGSYQALAISISVSAIVAGLYLWSKAPKDKKATFEQDITNYVDRS